MHGAVLGVLGVGVVRALVEAVGGAVAVGVLVRGRVGVRVRVRVRIGVGVRVRVSVRVRVRVGVRVASPYVRSMAATTASFSIGLSEHVE